MFVFGEYEQYMFKVWLHFDAFDIFGFTVSKFFELILACSFYAKNHPRLAFHGPIFRAWICRLASVSRLSGVCACCGMCVPRVMHFVWP